MTMQKVIQRLQNTIDRFCAKQLGGHMTIGNLTLYGWNAMHVAANLYLPQICAFVCVHPTTPELDGRRWTEFPAMPGGAR